VHHKSTVFSPTIWTPVPCIIACRNLHINIVCARCCFKLYSIVFDARGHFFMCKTRELFCYSSICVYFQVWMKNKTQSQNAI
jgi:hypothetical protein